MEKESDYNLAVLELNEFWQDRISHSKKNKRLALIQKYNRRHPDATEYKKRLWSEAKAIEHFFSSFYVFAGKVLGGEMFKIEDTDYYKYLRAHIHPNHIYKKWAHQRAMEIAEDSVRLIEDIRSNGVRDDFDICLSKNGQMILYRGYRRLVILKILGRLKFRARIWKSRRALLENERNKE